MAECGEAVVLVLRLQLQPPLPRNQDAETAFFLGCPLPEMPDSLYDKAVMVISYPWYGQPLPTHSHLLRARPGFQDGSSMGPNGVDTWCQHVDSSAHACHAVRLPPLSLCSGFQQDRGVLSLCSGFQQDRGVLSLCSGFQQDRGVRGGIDRAAMAEECTLQLAGQN